METTSRSGRMAGVEQGKRWRLVVALLAFALLVGACGGSDGDAGGADGGEAPAMEESDERGALEDPSAGRDDDSGGETASDGGADGSDSDEPPEPEDVPAPSGELRVSVLVPLRTWNPHVEPAEVMDTYYNAVFEKLVDYDSELRLQPELATSWLITSEAIEFELREDVVFHDGTPFDAEAVRWNIEHAKSTPSEAATALAVVESVEVTGPHAVRLNLSSPAPQLVWKLAQAPGMMLSPGSVDVDTTPVGTGPWQFDPDGSGAGAWRVEVFEDYWDPAKQGLEAISFTFVPDAAARTNALLAGETDVAVVNPDARGTLDGAGVPVLESDSSVISLSLFDRERGGVFEDPRVREAISLAIDRDRLLVDDYGDTLCRRFVTGEYGGGPNEGCDYDPDQARALLAEAGVDGLEFDAPSFFVFDDINQIVQAMLAEVGVTMNIVPITPGTLEPEAASGNYEASVHPVVVFHPASLYSDFLAPDALWNVQGIEPTSAAAAASAFAEADFGAADELWAEVDRLAAEDRALITLFRPTVFIGVSQNLIDPAPVRNVANAIVYDGLRFASN